MPSVADNNHHQQGRIQLFILECSMALPPHGLPPSIYWGHYWPPSQLDLPHIEADQDPDNLQWITELLTPQSINYEPQIRSVMEYSSLTWKLCFVFLKVWNSTFNIQDTWQYSRQSSLYDCYPIHHPEVSLLLTCTRISRVHLQTLLQLSR